MTWPRGAKTRPFLPHHSPILREAPSPRMAPGWGERKEERGYAPSPKGHNSEITPNSSSDTLLARTLSCDHSELQRRLGNVVYILTLPSHVQSSNLFLGKTGRMDLGLHTGSVVTMGK